MNTKQRTAMIFVLLLSLAISSCASGQLFGPTATVTPTLTPTPVATSTPTESHEEIITDAIKTACQMKPAGSPSVGVSAGGSAVARLCPDVDSSLTLPDKWTAKTPGDLLYAVAVQSRSAEFSVKCGPYTKDGLPGGEIYVTLETKNAHISLINAQTGQMVDSAAVSGPHTCPQTIYNTTTSVIGPPPVDDDVLNTIDNLMSKWTTTWSTPPGPVAFSVDSVAFSPDGKLLASGSDKMVNVWNLASGHIVETLPVGYWVGFAFSPDGRLLASGSNEFNSEDTVILWDMVSGNEVNRLQDEDNFVRRATFSPDGKLLATGALDGQVTLWDVASGKEVNFFVNFLSKAPVNSIAFSPDGRLLASAVEDNTVILWDVASGNEVNSLVNNISTVTEPYAEVYSVAFSPDGRLLASGLSDNTVTLWDVASGKEVNTLTGHTAQVNSVAFSPDGKLLASGSDDKTVKLWDVASWQEVRTLEDHTDTVTSIAFSPDGKLLASGSQDGTIVLWDVASGKTWTPR